MGAAFGATARQAFREPALLIAFGATLLLLVLAPLGTAFGFSEEEGLVRDIGLSTLFLGGILCALVTGSLGAEGDAAETLLAGPARLYLGRCAGAFAAHAATTVSLAACGFVALRHRDAVRADGAAFGLLAAVAVAMLAAGLWAPAGGLRTSLPDDDVLLLGGEALCLGMSAIVFAAAWAGGAALGKTGGLVAAGAVVLLGVVRDSLGDLPAAAAALVPNLGVLWPGDLMYADLAALPAAYVVAGELYALVWCCGALAAGLGLCTARSRL